MYIKTGVQPLLTVLSVLLITSNSQTVKYNRDCECGVKNYNTTRIYNGEESRPNEYPWLALVVASNYKKESGLCGGSIINNFNVLTAAHCFFKDTVHVKVFLGVHAIRGKTSDEDIREYTAQDLYIHPRYDGSISEADIALIKLSEEIRFSRTVRPICLPKNARELRRSYLLFAGWGDTEHGHVSHYLKHTRLRQMSRKECSEVLDYKRRPCRLLPKVICAYHRTNIPCKGDSGGPIMSNIKGYDRVLVQTGLLSFGDHCPNITNISNDRNINMATVNVFTKVAFFLNWIYSKTKDSSYCVRPDRY